MCPVFLSAIYVREKQPHQATAVAYSPGRLSVLIICATNVAPTNANAFN